jgi:predicted nuclease with TOPRIM domain
MDSKFVVDVRILYNNASITDAVSRDMKEILPVVHCPQP